ncbi:MAG TPA: folate-binding protein [Terriglobales bacterium]
MDNPALQSRLAPAHSRLGRYNGVEAALDFGDPAQELCALQSGCGVFDLGWRAKVSVTGKDRARWLHNMVTNNVRDLALNRGVYNFVLSAQGRILGDMYIYNRGDFFLIDTDWAQAEPLLTAMKRFIIMDKVEMNVVSEITAIGLCGPKAGETMAAAGLKAHNSAPLEIREQQLDDFSLAVVSGPENKPGWYEIWIAKANPGPAAIHEKLIAAGAQRVGAEGLEAWRMLHGIPNYGQDIRERDLPQETGQMQALSFTKGCYIGQEIVERIRSRGHVHRTFVGFEFTGEPPTPAKFEADGRNVAEVTSVARVPSGSGQTAIGLGYVRREIAADGQVDLNGQKARIVELPFVI